MINKTTWCLIFIIASQFVAVILPPLRPATWALNVLSITLLPLHRIFNLNTHFPRYFGIIYIPLILFDIALIVRGVIEPNGQILPSIIGNPAFATFHTLPLFILLATSDKILYLLYRSFKYVIVLSFIIGMTIKSISLSTGCVYFFVILYPFIKNKRIRLFYSIMVIFLGIMVSLILDMRMVFMGVVFFITAVLLIKNTQTMTAFRNRAKLFCFIFIFLPFSLFIVALTTGYSIFNISQELQFLEDTNDTRTFVWQETLTDLSKNNAIVFGKGMSGSIKTQLQSFVDPTVKNGRRLFVESSFLEYFRRGGVIMVLLNLAVLIWAVTYACLHSQNRMLLLAAMSLTFFFLLSFVGHVAVFSHEYILFWLLCGLCLSKKWNQYTDLEIYQFVHRKTIISQQHE